VYNGESPYKRHTYRYTPIAAYICLVNIIIHPMAGKIIFCLLDIVMGRLMWSLMESQNSNKRWIVLYVGFWCCNPITVGLSTRGSNDNIITMLVFASIYLLLKRKYVLAGFLYGFSVHFKIYPIIFSFVFYLFIDCDRAAILSGEKTMLQLIFTNFFTRNRVVFTLVSASTFFAFTLLFYYLYGWEFLYEGYFYHFIRKDNRHNNSVFFYLIY